MPETTALDPAPVSLVKIPRVYSLAETWPHVKPRAVRVGNGRRTHATLGAVTGCGKVWGATLGESDSPASLIDCGLCVKAVDTRNTWNRRSSYGARASFENESFGAGAGQRATEWRTPWYARETVSTKARQALGLK